jgi:hypothetical protein
MSELTQLTLLNVFQCCTIVLTNVVHFIYKCESNKNLESVMKNIHCAAAGTVYCQCRLVHLIRVCVVIVCALNYKVRPKSF